MVEESLAYSPLAEVEKEVSCRVLADSLYRAMKVIWVKVKLAVDINTGTLFESVRFPSTMEVQGGVSFTCLTACHKPSESISRPVC